MEAQCAWVGPEGRCDATEDLVSVTPMFSAPRLLCPAHAAVVDRTKRSNTDPQANQETRTP